MVASPISPSQRRKERAAGGARVLCRTIAKSDGSPALQPTRASRRDLSRPCDARTAGLVSASAYNALRTSGLKRNQQATAKLGSLLRWWDSSAERPASALKEQRRPGAPRA